MSSAFFLPRVCYISRSVLPNDPANKKKDCFEEMQQVRVFGNDLLFAIMKARHNWKSGVIVQSGDGQAYRIKLVDECDKHATLSQSAVVFPYSNKNKYDVLNVRMIRLVY